MQKSPLLPGHIGLIPDGARRWAKKNDASYREAYTHTVLGITNFINFMFNQNISSISIYLLSRENLNRKPPDLEPVIIAEVDLLVRLLPPTTERFKVKVLHAGNAHLLPSNYAEAMSLLCQQTVNNIERYLYLLAAYDPLDELMAAFRCMGKQSINIKHLWVPESLDLVIRTSGEHRLSNFLPLQTGFAEFIFVQKHFNDLCEQDLAGFLDEYRTRQRRYGR